MSFLECVCVCMCNQSNSFFFSYKTTRAKNEQINKQTNNNNKKETLTPDTQTIWRDHSAWSLKQNRTKQEQQHQQCCVLSLFFFSNGVSSNLAERENSIYKYTPDHSALG